VMEHHLPHPRVHHEPVVRVREAKH
jgi:hypothetical protein